MIPNQTPLLRRRQIGRACGHGDQIVNSGMTLALPGQPASMRGRTR